MTVIIHIDIDCFYAQVEMIRDPTLIDKPIGIRQNQTISTYNYVARSLGLKKMTHISEAKKIIPNIVIIQAHMELYRETSRIIFEQVKKTCQGCILQITGIDEAYIDATKWAQSTDKNILYNIKSHCFPSQNDNCDINSDMLIRGSILAERIRNDVRERCGGYTLSAGISFNKFLSKIACGLHKPNDQTIIFSDAVKQILNPLP
jgi:DNA polymerase iota